MIKCLNLQRAVTGWGLVLTLGAGFAQTTGSATIQVPADSKAIYDAVTSKLDAGGIQFSFSNYEGNISALFKMLNPALDADPKVEIIGTGLKKGLVTLGLDKVSVGSSTLSNGSGLETHKLYIRAAGRPGVWGLAGDPAAGPLESLADVPADAQFLWAGHFEFSRLMPLVNSVAQSAIGLTGPKLLEDQISSFEKETSVPLRKILASMGNEYCAYMVPPKDASTTESQLVVKLKVTDDVLFQAVATLKDDKVRVNALPDEGAAKIVSIEFEGDETKIYFAGYKPGWVTVSENDKALREALSSPSSGKLLDKAEFKELVKEMPNRVDAIKYIGSDYATTQLSELRDAIKSSTEGGNKNMPETMSKVFKTLPEIIENSGYWGQSIAWRINDPDGILWVETGKEKFRMNATAIAGGGVMVAIAVPAFLRARENARGRACQENLSRLDGAKEQWALENKKPIGSTVTMEDLKPYLSKVPVCHAGGTYNLNKIGEVPTCSYGDSGGENAVEHSLPD